jgi:hypothetical protein
MGIIVSEGARYIVTMLTNIIIMDAIIIIRLLTINRKDIRKGRFLM